MTLPLAVCFRTCAQPATLTNLWFYTTAGAGDNSAALATDGTIYFGTWLGQFIALNPDGSCRWVFQAGREIRSSPAVGPDGTLYFGSRDHSCYAVSAEGKKRWTFKTGGWVDSSPAVTTGGMVYFGSWDKSVYALRADGSKSWAFETGAPVVSSPAVGADGRIFFGSHDTRFYALLPNGSKAWDFATGGPIISSPALDRDGTVYFTSVDGCFYALQPDGTLKWRFRTGGVTESSPVLGGDGTIYVGVNKKLWAFAPDGRKQWEREATSDEYQQPIEASPTALADGTVLLLSNYGLLMAVEQSGPAKWMFYLFGHGPGSPAVGPKGTVYIMGRRQNQGSGLLALPATVPLAQSPWPKFRGNPQNTGQSPGQSH